MISEALLVLLALAASFVPVLAGRRLLRGWTWAIGVVLVAAFATGVTVWHSATARRAHEEEFRRENLPRPRTQGGYVSSDKCRSCHPSEYASWHRTFHRTMTQHATPESVVGDFSGVTLPSSDGDFYLERRDDEYWAAILVELKPGGGPLRDRILPEAWRQILMTTGSHQTQIYWGAGNSPNELVILPFAYLILERRWVPLRDAFLKYPEKVDDHGTLWNLHCIQCHATGGQPRPAEVPGEMDTRVGELGIACEACHGPGEEHVRVNSDPTRRYGYHLAAERDPTIVNPARESSRSSSQICGQCHGIFYIIDADRFRERGFRYRPGDDLEQIKPTIRPREPEWRGTVAHLMEDDPTFLLNQFWSDGAVRVSGREYSGMIESGCYQRGELSCLSCHSMHSSEPVDQLAAGMEADEACLQCHERFRGRIEEHTHHRESSSGSRCYNCHMPHTVYGLLKAHRSHLIASPTVRESTETGRPNACNVCHLDESLGWTQQHLAEWYGTPEVALGSDETNVAASLLWLLKGDAGQRALAAWAMGWKPARAASGDEWLPPFLARVLDDPYAAVRFVAGRSLRSLSGFAAVSYDHLAAPEDRLGVQKRVLDSWKRSGVAGRSAVLITAEGTLDEPTIGRLLTERDDTQLDLRE